jgi:hypothetical protein
MDLDLVDGTVIVSTGLFIFLIGLAIYGIVISGAMFATALASMMQRRENIHEMRRFNTMMLQLQHKNELWYGNPRAKDSFPGLRDLEKKIEQEFLEDRD